MFERMFAVRPLGMERRVGFGRSDGSPLDPEEVKTCSAAGWDRRLAPSANSSNHLGSRSTSSGIGSMPVGSGYSSSRR